MSAAITVVTSLAAFFIGMRFVVAFFNFVSRPYLPKRTLTALSEHPLVDILIPARNEEANIGHLISDLRASTYKNFTLTVYDDGSTDSTAQIVGKHSAQDTRVSLIRGAALPQGWNGKNFACYRLAQSCNGRYLLFLDADVRVSYKFLEMAMAYITTHKAKMISIFPQQLMYSKDEATTVPIMNWILLSLLPVRLVRLSGFASLSAANGQMMLFDANVYHQYEPHSRLRASRAEDIETAYLLKKQREKIALFIGNHDIFCRMYTCYDDAIEGFGKNVRSFFGGNRFWMVSFLGLVLLSPIVIALFQGILSGLVALLVASSIRLFTTLTSKQNLWLNVILAPQQAAAFVRMVVRNLQSNSKKIVWKGREV